MKIKLALGIHIGHDRGASLIQNGTVLGAIAQERLDRIKYSRSYEIPFESIDALLTYHQIKIKDISCIGLSCDAIEGESIIELIQHEFYAYYQITIPFVLVNHHDAHAYSVYYSSGFDDSLVFIADGGGDYVHNMVEAESLYLAKAGRITRIKQRLQSPTIRRLQDISNYIYPMMPTVVKKAPISIARKYEQFTYLLGFGWGEAGKTMGLASYGKPTFCTSLPETQDLDFSLTYGDLIENVYAQQILSNLPFKEFVKKNREDIASSIQLYTQEMIISLINVFFERYKCKNICLAGGLFLNCLSNQQVIEKCHPDNFFVLPCAGDDGQALGCAYYAYTHYFEIPSKFTIDLPYLGLSYEDSVIEESLNARKMFYQHLTEKELAIRIAEHIANNKIIAFHKGRTEIGPRALCHRSILANPSNPKMKDILNARVKHRENFRPFAPTVIAEEQQVYFNLSYSSDYMLLAADVKPEYRELLSSVTHVDGTARVQAVHKEKEPFIHSILIELKKQIGVPVVLNTSLNVAGEPITETPHDTILTYLKTDIDILVIENYIVEDKSLRK